MRKFILLLFISFINLTSIHSQENVSKSDTSKFECVRESWLTIYKDTQNILFQPDSELDVFEEIKSLLIQGRIRLWKEQTNNNAYLTSPLPSMLDDSIAYLGGSLYYNPYFDYEAQGFETLKTSTGKDSMYFNPDGTMEYLYPIPKYAPVRFENISEIRIKEILIYDSINQVGFMKPSLVGFDVYAGYHNLIFWVKVDDLLNTLEVNRQWIEYIGNKKYSGFVYMRYSCNDPDYKWKKVYH